MRGRGPRVTLGAVFALAAGMAHAQDSRIGIIDYYGLRVLSEAQVSQSLSIKIGDTMSLDEIGFTRLSDAEETLAAIPGVRRARVQPVCCADARWILFVGIEEDGAPAWRAAASPAGRVRLRDDVAAAGKAFETALIAGLQRGNFEEDDSHGHALHTDPALRVLEDRFLDFARRDLANLRDVLRNSADAAHRGWAAQILGYAPDKRAVIKDLNAAVDDPASTVRNNAIRALLVISLYASKASLRLNLQPDPFVRLLNSPDWTDRNKSAGLLAVMTKSRETRLLRRVRQRALPSLVEMARWKSRGHAEDAARILGRIGGLSEEAINTAWQQDDRERLIQAAINVQ